MVSRTPPGWPDQVPPSTAEDWLVQATHWLLDQLPGEYREFDIARRHPILLARLALLQIRAEVGALRSLITRIRVDLREFLTPTATESAIEMLERRLARLAALERQVTLVTEAIERGSMSPRV